MKIVLRLVLKGAIREFNAQLLRLAKSFRPHLVLFVKGPYVYAESIRKLKDLGICCICFYPDVSMMVHGAYIPKAIPEYDWIFTTKSFGPRDLARLFSVTNCSYLPHAADPEIHKPRQPRSADELSEYGCDLAFIGGWSEGKEAVLTRMAAALPGLKIKIWGNRWENVSASSILAPFIQFREILGPSYALAVGAAKINLALVHEKVAGASSGDLITSRTFHIPACGGFMLHQRTPDLAEVFIEDEECAAFADANEAIEKIGMYLEDEAGRLKMAERGRARVDCRTSLGSSNQENPRSLCSAEGWKTRN